MLSPSLNPSGQRMREASEPRDKRDPSFEHRHGKGPASRGTWRKDSEERDVA